MSAPDEIDLFMRDFEAALPLTGANRQRVVAELRAHLADAVAAEERSGGSPELAARIAIERLGAPRDIARRYPRHRSLLDGAILVGAGACAVVGAWLFFVAATVVPERDPVRTGFWNGVAVAYLGYAVVTAGYVMQAGRWRAAAPAMIISSVTAFIAGAWLAGPMLLNSGEFEGYIVLMGVVLHVQAALVAMHASGGRSQPVSRAS